MGEIWEPVSLGAACEVKYQIARQLYFRKNPDAPAEAVRQIMKHGEGRAHFPRQLFDWQITPLPAVVAYLDNDFRGVFELEDLEWSQAHNGVAHKVLGTRHPHDFVSHDGRPPSEETFKALYPAARAKFDRLADGFRQRLRRPGPYLYITTDSRDDVTMGRLIDRLSAGSPEHRFKVMVVTFEDWGVRDETFGDRLVRAMRSPDAPGKTPDQVWEGDDDAWDQILRDWPLGIHPPAAAGTAPAEAAPRQGFLSRLLGR